MYRTRLVSTRIPEREKREIAEFAAARPTSNSEWDLDACRAMLFAVLETAIRGLLAKATTLDEEEQRR